MILFTTITGSRLYGLAGPDSDYDTYTVVTQPRDLRNGQRSKAMWHQIHERGGRVVDETIVGVTKWLELCQLGTHQALEAMFSTQASAGPLDHYRATYRVDPHTTRATYRRTIRHDMTDATANDLRGDHDTATKKRRHALRLAYNLREALEHGRFSPTLPEHQRTIVLTVATSARATELHLADLLDGMAWQETADP